MTAFALKRSSEDLDWSSRAAGFAKARAETIRIPVPEISPPSTATMPAWVDATRAQMQALQRLPDNWDGRGSAEVSGDTIYFTGSMLSSIMPPTAPAPAIVPLGHGGVQLMWQNAIVEIEVEVAGPNHAIAYYFNKATGEEREETLTSDFGPLASVLSAQFQL